MWINYTIHGLDDPNRPFPYDNFDDWNTILKYNNQVINKVNRFLDSLLNRSHNEKYLDTNVHRINNDKIKRAVKRCSFSCCNRGSSQRRIGGIRPLA